MDIEIIKKKFLGNEKMTSEELLLVFEDILDKVIHTSRFENTANAYYTIKNFNIIKTMLFEYQTQFPHFLDSKIDKVMMIERNELRKEFKIWRNIGFFICLFGIMIYFLTERSTSLFAISSLLIGIIFIWRGIDGLGKLKSI
nr:hypothetical protein [Flavobacterium sp. ASV13]